MRQAGRYGLWECARFEPTTAMAIAAVAAVAAAGVSAAGAVAQGNQQKAMADFNAAVSERDAQAARQQSDFEAQRHKDAADRLKSAQIAAAGKSGLELEGSPLLVIADTASEAELDRLAIKYSGSIAEARARSQAALDRLQGRAAKTASYYQAGSSILSGVSGAASAYGLKPSAGKTTVG